LDFSQHKKALDDSGVVSFVLYTMRHTALTRLGEAADNNVFAVAQIARHASLSTTKRYVHPQAEAISRVFAARTKLGTSKKRLARAHDRKSGQTPRKELSA
jgi:integrase